MHASLFDESFDWYAARDAGAALGFALSVDAALDSVQNDPGRLPKTKGNCHYCLLKKYPFRIVYRDEPDRLVVVAVAHAKRDPGYWHERT